MAQFNLGLMYMKGLGVKADYVEGWAWLDLAAKGGDKPGDKPGAKARKFLAKMMSSEQVALAQKRTKELENEIFARKKSQESNKTETLKIVTF